MAVYFAGDHGDAGMPAYLGKGKVPPTPPSSRAMQTPVGGGQESTLNILVHSPDAQPFATGQPEAEAVAGAKKVGPTVGSGWLTQNVTLEGGRPTTDFTHIMLC